MCIRDSTLPNLSTNPLKLSSDSPHRTKSSAYNRYGTLHSTPFSTILTPFPAIPTSNSFITPSIYKLNNQGDITQPCLTPLLILNQSPLTPFILTHASLSSYIFLIPFRSLPPTPYITNICHRASLLILLYACCKSIKPKYNLFFFSLIFSIICLKIKISSTHPLPFLNAPCSSPISPSVTRRTLSTKIAAYIFPTTLNKLIPLSLIHISEPTRLLSISYA